MSKIKIYKDNPTVGLKDGVLVSSGTGSNPIESGNIKVPEEGFAEGAWIKLAIRCDEGFKTVEDYARQAQISIEGTEPTKWQLAPDNGGQAGTPIAWGSPLDITSEVGDINTIFWARARVDSTEEPKNDTSANIKVTATIGAV